MAKAAAILIAPMVALRALPEQDRAVVRRFLFDLIRGLDGIAAALGLDDRRFKPLLVDSVLGEKPGCVIVAVGVHVTTTIGEL